MSASQTAVSESEASYFAASDPRRWLALGVMCFTVLLISLDATVLNVALPTLVVDLHPSASGVQWIADSYVLTEAVLLLLGGAVGDRFGRRLLFLGGVIVFGAGSAACAMATSAGFLIGARAVTGVGAAMLMPVTLALIAATFPPWERSRAIGMWAGIGGIGTAAGPLIGGWLLQHFWWGSVFIINVPVAVIAFIGGIRYLPESKSEAKPVIDPVGVGLSALGLAGITYGLIVAADQGWGSGSVIVPLIAGALLVLGFVGWDRRREEPLVDFGLFRNPTFSTGLAAITAAFFSMFGVSFLLSQYIQFVQKATVFGVGLRFLPMAVGTLIGSNSAHRLTGRFGVRAVVVTGMLLVGAALAVYTTLSASADVAPVIAALSSVGVGMGLIIAPASNAVISSVPPDKVGVGSGLRATVQLLGGSFSVAIIGNLVTTRYRDHVTKAFHGSLAQLPAGSRPAVASQIGTAVTAAKHLPSGLAAKVNQVAGNAFVSGVRLAALVTLCVMAVAVVAVARYIPVGRLEKPAGTVAEEPVV